MTKQGLVVYEKPVTLVSLDEASLADRFKVPKSGQRDVDFGGQLRMRYHREENLRNSATVANGGGLTGASDDFLLYRTRLWMNATVNKRLHAYFELLDAESTLEDLPPRTSEVDRLDLHQAYVDLAINERLQLRIGRQAIDLAARRLVGTDEWANTRRAFDGLQVSLAGDQVDFDAYYLQPLSTRPHDFNRTNHDISLYGINTHQHVDDDITLDYYWLALELDTIGARYDTLGVYWKGARGNLLYELEGGVQVDTNFDDTEHKAGFGTIGLGTNLQGRLAGQLWVYYDWASGSNSSGNGFHHYFPRAHAHLGFMDLFGRRNINDLNIRWTHEPSDRLKFLLWYHYFSLANTSDVPYNTNMTPFAGLGPNTSGNSSLGHELDLLATFTLSDRI
ncbi:MAG: alginate export family protein, partial [Pirellulaceae bacterium]